MMEFLTVWILIRMEMVSLDNIEAQTEDRHINPEGIDINENGLDDIYESGSNVGYQAC